MWIFVYEVKFPDYKDTFYTASYIIICDCAKGKAHGNYISLSDISRFFEGRKNNKYMHTKMKDKGNIKVIC